MLSLYDTLTQLGYETFLDQFVLDTASRLARALEDNLNRSQVGILIWSPRAVKTPIGASTNTTPSSRRRVQAGSAS